MTIHPFEIGDVKLPTNIIYAPLAGCSDLPFREICFHFHKGLKYCEMVKMEPLLRDIPSTHSLLDYRPGTGPIGAQICGSNPKLAGDCAKIIEDKGFHVLDFNCGCPVDKVTKDKSGSGMLRHPELIGEILSNMIARVKIPVTVKIRIGWDEQHINACQVTKIAEEAGAKVITIHGRTREQKYTGKANWNVIKACKETAKEIKVIANGDIFDGPSAKACLELTKADGILLARGTFGKPWLGEEITRFLHSEKPLSLTSEDHKEILLKHMALIVGYLPEKKAVLSMRRIGCWYLRNAPGAKKLREHINHSESLIEIERLIRDYTWYEVSFLNEVNASEEVTC